MPTRLILAALLTLTACANTDRPTEARPEAPAAATPMTPLFDFSAPRSTDSWFVVNDRVMGGHSQGHVAREGGTLVFYGDLVTRDGGFSAARTDKAADLSGLGAIEITLKGDGRTYELELSDGVERRGEMVSRRVPFETTSERQTVRLVFADLEATVFGEPVDVPAFDPAKLAHMGVFIADEKDGPFRLEVMSIRAVE